MVSPLTRGLGWKRDAPKLPLEKPDRLAGARLMALPPPPYEVSNKNLIVEVLDQGQLGYCVFHSVTQGIRGSLVHQGVKNPPLPSRLTLGFCTKSYTHDTNIDNGSQIRLAFTAANHFGFAPESLWPYSDDERFMQEPPADVIRQAYDQRAPTVYERINETGFDRLDVIKRACAAGHLVCFGTQVSEKFCSTNPAGTIVSQPSDSDVIAGGHALLIAGYKGDNFLICNSWGPNWGEEGYCWFSSDYIAWSESDDFWIVTQSPIYSTVTP